MELVRGGDLAAALAARDSPLYAGGARRAARRAAALSRQLLRGLAHMHRTGVLHQDVKPANILVDRGGDALKLADYGLAAFAPRRADPWTGRGDAAAAPFTGCTPRYASPEARRVAAVLERATSAAEYEGGVRTVTSKEDERFRE